MHGVDDMSARHLAPLTLARLRAGKLEPEVIAREVVPHLLSVCPGCQTAEAEVRRLVREVGHGDEVIAVTEGTDAPELWRRLERATSYSSQLSAVESHEANHTWGLCRLLQRRSEEAAELDPGRGVQLANLAVRIAGELGEAYDPHWVGDLRARGYGLLGAARRLSGEIDSAADAFDTAHALQETGTGAPALAAEILAQEALLLRDQHRLIEAETALKGAIEMSEVLASSAKDPADTEELQRTAGAATLHLAWCDYHQGNQASALVHLQKAERRLDPDRDRKLALALQAGKLWCVLALGRTEKSAKESEAALAAARELAQQGDSETDRLRLRHAEARLHLARGDRAAAEQALRALAPAFAELRLGIDAALAYLDLAALILCESAAPRAAAPAATADALRALAAGSRGILASPDLGWPGVDAVLRFQDACLVAEGVELTPERLRHLAQELERSRRPSLDWWSAWRTVLSPLSKGRRPVRGGVV
jgi:tetratricopeptide (TPR) repeat protein